jgi:thymidylate synthase
MLAITAISLPEAWETVLRRLMTDGFIANKTEYGNRTRYMCGVGVEIGNVSSLHKADPFGARRFAEYEKQFTKGYKHGFSYTYGERLMQYPTINVGNDENMAGERITWAETEELDQIEYIRNALNNGRFDSRRLQAVTWVPSQDMTSEEPPCLQSIWVYPYEDYTLDVHIRYWSWDWFGAAGSNILAISRFVERELCKPTGFKPGHFRAWGDNVHVYEYNWDEAMKVVGSA